MDHSKTANLLVRLGAAFAFLFPALDAIANPDSWIGYFPSFLQGIVPDALLLHSFGVVEIIIALFILSGRYVFWPAVLASFMLVAIVVFNFRDFEILFRDVSILAMTSALAVMYAPKRNN